MLKGLPSLVIALLFSIGSFAIEPPTLVASTTFRIQKLTVNTSVVKDELVQRPDLLGFNKPKDIFGFAQLRIVGDQFRVCCTPSGYGVKFKF